MTASNGVADMDGIVGAAEGLVYTSAVCQVTQGGQTLFQQAYGWLDPDTRTQPTQLNTMFDLASLTKPFTATLFMTLVEAGQVGLDQPVVEVVPEFRGQRPIRIFAHPQTGQIENYNLTETHVEASGVTFRHLLTHTSGLPAWVPLNSLPNRETALKAVVASDFAYPTGSRLVYSDLGMILVSVAIERLVGQPFAQIMHDRVLDPLGLSHTVYNPPTNRHAQVAPTEVCRWRGRRLRGEVHDENTARLDGVSGHAGLFSSATDLTRLGQLYLNGGTLDGVRLLSPTTVAQMTSLQVDFEGDRRGLGWVLQGTGSWQRPGLSERAFGHTGFTGTSLWVDPATQRVVVLLTNRVYFGRNPDGILALRQDVLRAAAAAWG